MFSLKYTDKNTQRVHNINTCKDSQILNVSFLLEECDIDFHE